MKNMVYSLAVVGSLAVAGLFASDASAQGIVLGRPGGVQVGVGNTWGNQGWGNQGWGNPGWGNQGFGNTWGQPVYGAGPFYSGGHTTYRPVVTGGRVINQGFVTPGVNQGFYRPGVINQGFNQGWGTQRGITIGF